MELNNGIEKNTIGSRLNDEEVTSVSNAFVRLSIPNLAGPFLI